MKKILCARDTIAGLVMLAIGIGAWSYAQANLSVGTLQRMGPGFFPAALGVMLAGLGLGIIAAGLRSHERSDPVEWRPAIAVVLALVAFALTVRTVGLLPAIVGTLVLSRFSSVRQYPRSLIVMVLIMPLGAWAIFSLALGLPLPLLRSPW